MTLPSEDIASVAQLIHDHGGMSAEVFGRSFDTLGRESRSRLFATVYALSDKDFLLAIKDCVRIAADNGFFEKLLAEISANLPNQTDLRGIVPTAIVLKAEKGLHEAVFPETGGLHNIDISDVVHAVTPMIGVIRDSKRDQEYVGTCFIVGSDLIMTAAHVIWGMIDFSKDPIEEIPGATDGVQVEFWNPGGRLAPGQPRVAKLAEKWLLAASEPCGTPPANLDVTNQELATTNHDFALVRIDEKIGDKIGILDVHEPVDAQMNNTLVVIGHVGGTQCKFHSERIHEHRRRTGRLHHAVNTAPGMSGGPCLDKFARVVGIHEGTVKSTAATYNRSVHMLPIRRKIRQLDDDPLSPWSKRLRWLPAPRATEAWTSLGYPKRTSDHPILGRAEFQEWIRRAAADDNSERLALVSGDEGSGKTFTGALMRAKLTDARDIFVAIAPEVTRLATIPNLFERLAVAAGISDDDPFRSRTRPETGLLRHDLIPQGMEALDRLLTKDHGQKSRLWLFLDFGKDEGWLTGREEDWMAFLNQALQRDWMRIVVAGISMGRQAEFHAALPAARSFWRTFRISYGLTYGNSSRPTAGTPRVEEASPKSNNSGRSRSRACPRDSGSQRRCAFWRY
ncbi:trypsin-like serine peptidase [Bradyrhizobium liaoningense]